MGEFAIGQGVSRFEDPRLLTGGGRFVDDVTLPRMTYGHVLRSPHAHARIRSIDTSAANRLSGVLAALTGVDWENSGWGNLPTAAGRKRRDGGEMYSPPYPALAKDRVRWVGDCVAFVVAEDPYLAKDAAELIEVDYEPLPAVVSTADASDEGVPLVWDDCPNNVCFVELMGDKEKTDEAFESADHVVCARFVINRVTAVTMEPRGCVGVHDGANDHYTLYTGVQRAFGYRSDLASKVLKVPENRVRIIAGDIGGSFGMKTPVSNEAVLTLLASKLTKRPVKWISTRSEAFLSDPQGRDNVTEAELALDSEGHFLGLRVRILAAVGAYLQPGMPNFTNNANSVAGAYCTPAIFVDASGVFTNTNPVRAYRGNGRPEAGYVIERLVDIAARKLGIHPAEIRRRNYVPPTAMPYKTALAFTYDSGDFEQAMDKALEIADSANFEQRREEARTRGMLRGLGISYTIERAGAGLEAAEIRVEKGGGVTLYAGSINHGQGHETIFKQIVSSHLAVDPRQVTYVQGDTNLVAMGEGTGGSRTATVGGSAVLGAAERVLAKAKRIAAHVLDVDADDVAFEAGIFTCTGTNQTLTLREIAQIAGEPSKLPMGLDPGLIERSVFNSPTANYPNGCHVCEVEIDPETGRVFIERYSVVDDVGTVINPLLLRGQIHGGVVQSVGQMLMEDICFDDSGQLLSGSFMDYAMPRASDVCSMEVENNPVPTTTNPLGVKGAGEAGTVGALPAVANAIVDALSPLGITHIDMPATPERIWQAITNATAVT